MDDPNEKSLFSRIKDCVLIELRRSRNEVTRSPCHSRSTWGWNRGKSDDHSELEKNKEKLREDVRTKVEDPQESVKKDIQDNGAEEKEKSDLGMKSTILDEGEDNGKAKIKSDEKQRANERDSCSTEFKPVKYWIKMQDPEAPKCCEPVSVPRKICPPKIKQPQTKKDVYGATNCRCGGTCTS